MNEKSSTREKFSVARLINREMREVVDKWEKTKAYQINCCWDHCIIIDDELFDFPDGDL